MSLKDQLQAMQSQLSPDAFALLGAMVDRVESTAQAVVDGATTLGEHAAKISDHEHALAALEQDVGALKSKDVSEAVDQLTTRVAAAEKSLAAPASTAPTDALTAALSALAQRVEVLESSQNKQ